MQAKMTFRWYGKNDPVSLDAIRQIPGMTGIVSAVYDVPPGELWPVESITSLREDAHAHGLAFEVVESVPVHEDIKLGNEKAEERISVYCENLRRLGKEGVKCVCYNFMPVFDWLRSDLKHPQPDGANALAYAEKEIQEMDPLAGDLSLPGWDASYTKEQMKDLIVAYRELGTEGLWKNLETFLSAVIPVAKEAGIRMAIHPDDPPWSLFGLPRIVTNRNNLERLLALVPEKENGLTLCTGSLGADPDNDLVSFVHSFAGRIHFVHLRNILRTGPKTFEEVGHPTECGSLDMFGIGNALVQEGFDGYVRPDHGRMIWGEQGKPGYGLYDRALGAAYLLGLFEAAEKSRQAQS
ncbi:MAG: mannonate dehydratase [Clostridia bacterium]|nr:mannonate dehydratase [Clostridia bacterium]